MNLFNFRKKQKVFCIGYNKTGTTTVEQVLSDLGYKMPNQAKQESLTVEEMFRGNYKPLISLCKKYDAFQDMPFSQSITYAIVDALFPKSKFILNVRDSNDWFESLTRFHLKGVMNSGGIDKLEDFSESTYKDKNVYLYENYMYNITKRHAVKVENNKVRYDWSLVYDKDYRIDRYERRNREIISFFRERPEQLLVIDITKEKDNSKIVEFLGLPKKNISDLPHLNSSK